MAVQIIVALYREEELTSLKVLDCCCGTGGFLVSWLNSLYRILVDQEQRREAVDPLSRARERVRTACDINLFGLDINPHLVRTAQMNLVLHGDGSSNIFRADSARNPGEWEARPRQTIPYGSIDVVLTNPPFGGKAKVDDAHILDQYELSRWESENPRSILPAEQLFVEAALKFLRPGGHMAIVLPDGILNNPSLQWIRSWLLRRTKLIASVDLPKTTFSASGGVNNPSVVVVRKFYQNERTQAEQNIIDTSYEVFMSTPRTSGINSRGNPIYLRHPDGQLKADYKGRNIIDDEIAGVAEGFRTWRGL